MNMAVCKKRKKKNSKKSIYYQCAHISSNNGSVKSFFQICVRMCFAFMDLLSYVGGGWGGKLYLCENMNVIGWGKKLHQIIV